MDPATITHGAVLLIGVILGVGGLAAVQWLRGEAAFTRYIDEGLDAALTRFRQASGTPVGVVENVPPHMESPPWWRGLPGPVEPTERRPAAEPWDPDPYPDGDDEDAFPRDETRVTHGGWRQPGQHRLRGDDTQDLTRYAGLFDEVKVAAP